MKLGLGLTVLAAAFALTACGSSGAKISNDQQAAQAVFGAGNMGNQQQALLAQLTDRATTTGSATADCPKGGSVTATVQVDTSSTTASLSYKLDFNGCVTGSYTDPKTHKAEDVSTDGTLTYNLDASSTSTTSSATFTLNGHLDFSGGIDDSVDVTNLSYSVGTQTTGTTTSVSISVTGDIKTGSGKSFHYDGSQSYSFDGTITASANP